MLTREEILVTYEAGPEAVIVEIQGYDAIMEKQASHISELEERVRVLEARLNQNSQNSSKPPSTDVFCNEKPKPKGRHTSSGKKAGGQKGHPGKTLEMVENPD
jgi:PHD/YefM family antitoxin component YafN of YafNO toxin-antitoxin module